MRHLIVYAHPGGPSFCHAILERAVATLQEEGHEVVVRDLYAAGFNPVLSRDEIAGAVPPDVRAEQFFVRAAEVITFIYPVWWTNMPAVLKGYFDRVFAYDFAYTMLRGAPAGLLTGKKVIVINTQSSSTEAYRASGMIAAMHTVVDDGIFGLCSMEVVEHRIFPEVTVVDEITRVSYLAEVARIMHRYELAASTS
jgi:NAD(P)H dehydrogenase (quinone)